MANLGNIDHGVAVNNNAAGGGGVTILPDDDYELEFIESDVKANSKGSGQNAEFKVQVASGPFKGTWFFHSITSIQHTSAQAQTIGQGQLRAASEACGVDFTTLVDSGQLHFRPFWASVRSEEYFSTKHNRNVTKNVIAKFLWEGMPEDSEPAASAPPAAKSPATPPPPPAQAAPAAKARPWSKG